MAFASSAPWFRQNKCKKMDKTWKVRNGSGGCFSGLISEYGEMVQTGQASVLLRRLTCQVLPLKMPSVDLRLLRETLKSRKLPVEIPNAKYQGLINSSTHKPLNL